jgi:hypothetical protein
MEWVNGNVAIGSWVDHIRHRWQARSGIDACIDARGVFRQRFLSIGRRPDPVRVARAVQLIHVLNGGGYKVLVHCHHGRDRSPFLVMAYLSEELGIGYQEAFELVREGRPRAKYHPDWVEGLQGTSGGGRARSGMEKDI